MSAPKPKAIVDLEEKYTGDPQRKLARLFLASPMIKHTNEVYTALLEAAQAPANGLDVRMTSERSINIVFAGKPEIVVPAARRARDAARAAFRTLGYTVRRT